MRSSAYQTHFQQTSAVGLFFWTRRLVIWLWISCYLAGGTEWQWLAQMGQPILEAKRREGARRRSWNVHLKHGLVLAEAGIAGHDQGCV